MNHSTHQSALRRGRDPVKEAFWRCHIGRQAASDLSALAYCRRQGLSEALFYYWRQEIARRGASVSGGPAFVELRLAEGSSPLVDASAALVAGPTLELRLPRRRRVVIRQGFDPALLRQVLAALEPDDALPPHHGVGHREDRAC